MLSCYRDGGRRRGEQQRPEARELLENIRAKLRALFPPGEPDADEKRAEVLAFSSEQVLGAMRIHDVAAPADLPLDYLKKDS